MHKPYVSNNLKNINCIDCEIDYKKYSYKNDLAFASKYFYVCVCVF